jgi:hypothetical protein
VVSFYGYFLGRQPESAAVIREWMADNYWTAIDDISASTEALQYRIKWWYAQHDAAADPAGLAYWTSYAQKYGEAQCLAAIDYGFAHPATATPAPAPAATTSSAAPAQPAMATTTSAAPAPATATTTTTNPHPGTPPTLAQLQLWYCTYLGRMPQPSEVAYWEGTQWNAAAVQQTIAGGSEAAQWAAHPGTPGAGCPGAPAATTTSTGLSSDTTALIVGAAAVGLVGVAFLASRGGATRPNAQRVQP